MIRLVMGDQPMLGAHVVFGPAAGSRESDMQLGRHAGSGE
jgi:hypothetical protein